MNLNTITFFLIVILDLLAFILVLWTIYEFGKIDKDQFKYHMIGLGFFSITLITFVLRYFIFPPLSSLENGIFEFTLVLPLLIGVYFFVEGTRFLAMQEKSDLEENKLHLFLRNFILIAIVSNIFNSIISVYSEDIYEVTTAIFTVILIIVLILATYIVFNYKKEFSDLLSVVLFKYLVGILLFLVCGAFLSGILLPIEGGNYTFSDLSTFRILFALYFSVNIFILIIICFNSILKFKKILFQ